MLLPISVRHLANADNRDVHQGRGPLSSIHIGQLLQENLDFLAIRRTLRDKMEALTCQFFGVLAKSQNFDMCIPSRSSRPQGYRLHRVDSTS